MAVTGDRSFGARKYYDLLESLVANDMWHSSTRNCRIERLWVEVGSQFARRWRAFFTRLERMHMLDAQNPTHLWLLHLLFLDDIDQECQMFRGEWNWHPISGPGTNNKSPKVKFIVVSPLLISTRCRIYAFWANSNLASMNATLPRNQAIHPIWLTQS